MCLCSLDWNALWNRLRNLVYSRWQLCCSWFHPFPCTLNEQCQLNICTWPLTPKTSRRMHERRPNARKSCLWMCYQVNSYMTAAVLLYRNDIDVFLKFYSHSMRLETQGPCMECTRAWVTHWGLRLPYTLAQCMPIWVFGSRVPWSQIHWI